MPEKPEKNDTTDKKKRALDLISQAPAKAEELEKLGRDITSSARLVGEVAPAMHDLLSQVPAESLTPKEWEHQIEGWRDWHRSADELRKSVTWVSTFQATSYLTTNSSSTTASFIVAYPSVAEAQLRFAKEKLDRVLARSPLLDQARSAMRRLGLDRRGGNDKAALALLEDAQAGLGTSPAAALIPMRESMDAAIGELLRRRSRREPTPKLKEKLNSIGSQCGRPNLASDHFDRLAVDGDILINQLSGAKQDDLTKGEVSGLFDHALVFLNTLLGSLDERRLRPS